MTVYFDAKAKYHERWAVTTLAGAVSVTRRFQTEAEANACAGREGGSTDPDYDPRNT